MNPQKPKQFSSMTEQLNKALGKALEGFAQNSEWSDIPSWLANVESLLRQYPSPFIGDKLLLSKRLNQCMNPILPEKVHEAVIRIHQVIFRNMRQSVEGNVNDYIQMFSQDLGLYSLTLLPHFAHTSNFEQRLTILRLLNHYYLDLGRELIPMLSGLLKTLLSVHSTTINPQLLQLIELTLSKLLTSAGRRYVVGCTWSLILRYRDCKKSGLKFLSRVIQKPEDEEESRGFSDFQTDILQLDRLQTDKNIVFSPEVRDSNAKVLQHLEEQELQDLTLEKVTSVPIFEPDEPYFSEPLSPGKKKLTSNAESIPKIVQQSEQESGPDEPPPRKLPQEKVEEERPEEGKAGKKQGKKERVLYMSQAPFSQNMLKEEEQIPLKAVPLMVSVGIQRIREGIDDTNLKENNFPHLGSLVLSALINSLEEEEAGIRRTALDFMQSHLQIRSELLGKEERSVMVEALLRQFHRKDISIAKRANKWLFGRQDEEGRFTINEGNEFVVGDIIGSFKRILSSVPEKEESCTYPIKILQNFYIEHPHLVKETLSHISVELVRYIFNFGGPSSEPHCHHFPEILRAGKRFLQNLPSFYQVILASLGSCFVSAVTHQQEQLCFEAIKYLDFSYTHLMKHDHGYEELEYVTTAVDQLTQGLFLLTQSPEPRLPHRFFIRDTVLLTFNLLERRRGILKINRKAREATNRKYLIESGQEALPPERTAYLQDLRIQEAQQEEKFLSINAKMEQFFVQLGSVVRTFASIQQLEEVFKLSALTMVSLQIHLPPEECLHLPPWFSTLQSCIKVANPLISLSAIEAMMRCLMWEGRHPIYSSFKNVLLQQKAARKGIDYQKLALQKLWSLLDYPHMHVRIIDLIVSFSKYLPYELVETVKRSFGTQSAPDKQASIQRFAHFWRLTAHKYKDLLSKQEFAELSKVGLFRMLDFLDDPNPLVRHAAKSWLMESLVLLRRIMEPLLLQLIQGCAEWYETPKGLLLIQNHYDTRLIFSTFRRIRAILTNGSYSFLRFVYQAEISEYLNEQREKVTPIATRLLSVEKLLTLEQATQSQLEPVLPRALEKMAERREVGATRLSYLDMLLILAVKYIEGHAVESMGVDFYVGNAGVNASAVELVETLLDYIDSWELCEKVFEYLLGCLFRVLGQVVLNREYIMQVQLLNLLKNIFFNSSFRKKAPLLKVRSFFKAIFTSHSLLKALLQGLGTPFAYVRSQFIAFITLCIPLIADFLEPDECTICVRHILFSYYKIIKEIGAHSPLRTFHSPEPFLEQTPLGLVRIRELAMKAQGEARLVSFRDNLQQAGKANEMLSVLQGVESILNYFYDLDKVNPKKLHFEFSNPYTLFDTFKKILTLGLASSHKRPMLVERKNFLHNFDTCEALLRDLEPVYETILRAWPLSEEFLRIGAEEFTCLGMHSFHFERFSRYNKVVRELIGFVEEERESIWGKIYSIMQPLFCKFPKEIIDIYLKLWIRECPDSDGSVLSPDPRRTELLMKLMETIIVNNFPSNVVIHAFLESTPLEQLEKSPKGSPDKTFLSFQKDKVEAKLLYFLYVYFNYVYLNQKQLTYEPLLEVWSLIMKALSPFQKSQTPLAAVWTLEILNLCAKKYSPKELIKNERFKTDLHTLINKRLKEAASYAAREKPFFFQQALSKINYNEENAAAPLYHVVYPLPPTIHNIYRSHRSNHNHSDSLLLKEFRPGEHTAIETRYRLYCFKILKQLGLELLQNTYLPEKNHWVVKRTCEWMEILLQLIKDKSAANLVFAECASEVVHDLLEKARVLFIRELRPKLLQIFNQDDFFICSAPTLRYWADIVDWVVSLDKHCQTYLDYLQKVTLHSSYFSSESKENKQRVKGFERVCFILYAGPKDRYASKLNVLLAKIVDVIKKPENVHAALLILILFSVRILILRLSEHTLDQLFTDIWPMLLALLMQTFPKKLVRVQIRNEISKHPNYLLAALKLIEMISIHNLNEFANHQWIFVADYFGASLSLPELTLEAKQALSSRPQLAPLVETAPHTNPSPFIYHPLLLSQLPSSGLEYVPKQEHQPVGYVAEKRAIILKESSVKDEAELKMLGLLLMQYMNRLNEVRVEVDWREVEEVLVNDFITLDSFIHNIR